MGLPNEIPRVVFHRQVCEFSWFATQWSVCSSECSGLKGVQTRKVFCASVDANNTVKIEDAASCDESRKLESRAQCYKKRANVSRLA